MIEFKSISKSFDGKSVLSNFSIHIEENEFVSIVGKSGSGKTTLLNIISLLDYPDEGK
ncbi:ATP-binding cassette domain-containing protein, partial [Bacillus inaquosorum]|uniref:ATP-binding cassette domain-containing protein n=1 Tax=Bacillus inaquosorum TaxID=483913 RepID=UPI00227FAA1E